MLTAFDAPSKEESEDYFVKKIPCSIPTEEGARNVRK